MEYNVNALMYKVKCHFKCDDDIAEKIIKSAEINRDTDGLFALVKFNPVMEEKSAEKLKCFPDYLIEEEISQEAKNI